jgi:N-acetylneuraminate lyase
MSLLSDTPAAASPPITGLVAATFTPFDESGAIVYDRIPRMVDHLAEQGITGLYICGSTGEGPSLTLPERKAVTEAYLDVATGRLRTVVQIGHTSLQDVQDLAAHAAEHGAEAISAVAPYYFKPGAEELLAFYREAVKPAAHLPFYYYHIPAITGAGVDPVDFLARGAEELPSLRGIKFTDPDLSIFMACQQVAEGRYDALFGRDEMYLPALAAGCQGMVGSTYSLAPALYQRVAAAYAAKNHEEAARLQRLVVRFIRTLIGLGGESAIKYPLHRLGLHFGQRRLPMKQLSAEVRRKIDAALDAMGYDEWATTAG